MNYDIAYIVSHGFASRMLTQTNLLGKLVKAGNRVALITPDRTDSNLKTYCSQNDVTLFEFDETGHLSNQNYIFKRKYYLEDIENNPALWEKHVYATKFNRSLNPFTHLWPRYYIIIYYLIKKLPWIRENFKKNEKKYLVSQNAKKLLELISPKKLIATYPVNFNEAVLLHYGNQSTNTQTWIHLLSWDNITSKGHFPVLADKYIAWGSIMRDELKQFYNIKDNNINTCGVPHFDIHRKILKTPNATKYVTELGLDPNCKYLFFAMSSPRFAPKEIDIVEWLADKIYKNEFISDLQLIVRPHPQNVQSGMADLSWIDRLKRIGELDNVAIDMPRLVDSKLKWSMKADDMDRLAHLITGSVITINSGSTVSIDALLHKKPVILTSFDADMKLDYWRSARRLIDYTHQRKLVELGGVKVAYSFDDLKKLIDKYSSNPAINLEKIELSSKKQCGENKDSTESIVSLLSDK